MSKNIIKTVVSCFTGCTEKFKLVDLIEFGELFNILRKERPSDFKIPDDLVKIINDSGEFPRYYIALSERTQIKNEISDKEDGKAVYFLRSKISDWCKEERITFSL